MKKIIQIAVHQDVNKKVCGKTEIYALCENGDLWVGRYTPIDEAHPGMSKYHIVWINLLRNSSTD